MDRKYKNITFPVLMTVETAVKTSTIDLGEEKMVLSKSYVFILVQAGS